MSDEKVEKFKKEKDEANKKVKDEKAAEKESSGEEFKYVKDSGKKRPFEIPDGKNAGEENPVIIRSAERSINYLNKKIRDLKRGR